MGTFEKNKGYRTKLGTLDGLKLAFEREVMANGCHMMEKNKSDLSIQTSSRHFFEQKSF